MMSNLFKIFIFFSLLIVLTVSCFAQSDQDFPSLSIADIPEGKIIRQEYYPGDALWGIINGGADIYLEYGFDKLLLQEVEWQQINFRVEFYKMTDPTSAYGIFSVSHFKCDKRDTLSKYVCITPFQVQCALGRFYVSVANDKGTKDAQQLTIKLFTKILALSKEKLFEIPARFFKQEFAAQVSKLKVIKGALGFQNGFPMWSDKFEGFSNYTVYLLPKEGDKDYAYNAIINFSTNEEMKKFVSSVSKSKTVQTKVVSEKELLYFESNKSSPENLKSFFD